MSNELSELFLIKCKKCGSSNVSISPSSYDGDIAIYCNECKNEKEI